MSGGDEVFEFLFPPSVEQFVPVERGHHIDEAVDCLDQRCVTLRQGSWGRFAKAVLGGSNRARTYKFADGNAVSRSGLFDQIPLGIGEAD